MVKNPPAMQETWIRSLGREDPLEEGQTYTVYWKGRHKWGMLCVFQFWQLVWLSCHRQIYDFSSLFPPFGAWIFGEKVLSDQTFCPLMPGCFLTILNPWCPSKLGLDSLVFSFFLLGIILLIVQCLAGTGFSILGCPIEFMPIVSHMCVMCAHYPK